VSEQVTAPNVTLDVSPVDVRGVIRGSKARVIYADGKLYVALGINNVKMIEAPEPVQTKPGNGPRAVWETAGLTFYRRGCSTCGYTLNRHPAATLIAKAEAVA
jgi:hypothetical protein